MAADQLAVQQHTDPAAWNRLVAAHPQGHLLQSWGWGALKGSVGWEPLRIAVQRPDGTAAAAQVLFRRMLGLAVAYVPRGPLWSGDPQLDQLLLATLRRVAHRRRAAFLRLEPNLLTTDSGTSELHSWLQASGLVAADPLQPLTSIHLDLAPTAEQLLAAATKGHRADVRRAERGGVTVRVGSGAVDQAAFYGIMEATAARAQFGIHSAAYYAAAAAAMSEPWYGDGAARLLLAEQGGSVVAAFLIFAWGREGQYMYSGANDAGLKSGANHLLQWHAIQWAQSQGCVRYDLWGIPDIIGDTLTAPAETRPALEAAAQQHPLYGAYRFKKGWGGAVVRYLPAYDDVYFAPAYWWWKRRRSGA